MMNNRYLAHHGVKGQQWGVRNGPPYPIEDKILRKGTKINSVSSSYASGKDYKNSGRWMYTYRADEDWDNKVYKGPFSKYLVVDRGARWIAEHKYETVKDLTLANKGERVQEFTNLLDDPKTTKMVRSDLKRVQNLLVSQKVGNEQEQKEFAELNVDNIKTAKDKRVAYAIFQHAMEASWGYPSTKAYVDAISKKYDGMVDDNNVNIYNEAHDPIIIFKANQALNHIGTSFLTAQEIVDNYNKVSKELAKKGKKVKL